MAEEAEDRQGDLQLTPLMGQWPPSTTSFASNTANLRISEKVSANETERRAGL
ncbi:hypothetical protein J6590_003542 [Homalodisca vitripennis]|nr:hypothetical protein J6590_003542 [Homalodisca vitripennis]